MPLYRWTQFFQEGRILETLSICSWLCGGWWHWLWTPSFFYCCRPWSFLPRNMLYGQASRTVGTFSAFELHSWTSAESWWPSEIFGKNILSPWQFQRDTNHCNMLGPGPCLPSHPVQQYSVLLRERRGKQTNRHSGYPNPSDGHCSYSNSSDRHCT